MNVEWNVIAGNGIVSPAVAVTDADGVARAQWSLGTRPGVEQVTATAVTTEGPQDATFTTEILPGPVVHVRLTPADLLIGRSAVRGITFAAWDEYGNLVTRPARWTTSDPAVAQVDSAGVVTGVSAGTATIRAVLDGRTGEAHVTVHRYLLEDDFDHENEGQERLSYTDFLNWTVADGDVDLIGNGSKHDFLPGNGLYVDLDGYYAGGRLESKDAFALTPGIYTLEFELAGSQRGDVNTVTVSLGTLYSEKFTLPSDAPFTTLTRQIEVTSPTTARLSFVQAGADGYGLLLNRVRLSNSPNR